MKAGTDGAPKPIGLELATRLLKPGPPEFHPGYGYRGYSYDFGPPAPYGYGPPASAPQQQQPQTIVMGGAAGGGSGNGNDGCRGHGGCSGRYSGGSDGGDLVSSLSTLSGLKQLLQPQRAHRSRGLHANKPGYARVPASPTLNQSWRDIRPTLNQPWRDIRQVATPTRSVHGRAIPSNRAHHHSGGTVGSDRGRKPN